MNQKLKKVIIIVSIMIFIYAVFIFIECFRFSHFLCSKPAIILSKNESNNEIMYQGIGYYIIYKYNINEFSHDNIGKEIYSGEFRLFNIPINYWIT